MEILCQRQCFKLSTDGQPEFQFVKVVFRLKEKIFYGHYPKRETFEGTTKNKLENIREIPDEAYRPLSPSNITLAPGRNDRLYVKKPTLINYEEGSNLSKAFLREINVCETLRLHPHPNIALYHGCRVSDGRVDGICFTSYLETLMHKLNPNHLNKTEFLQNRQIQTREVERYFSEIEAGVKHLHSLGYVHNDLNPMNIMITDEDSAVIIDFDSCLKFGEFTKGTKRTHGWHDASVRQADEEVDFAALREIRVWLTGSSFNDYQFRN